MGRTLYDPVNPRQLGSLDPKLRSRVNGEIYRFANAANLARFERDPMRFCGILRDPVNEMTFVPDKTSRRLDWVDGPYFFFCDSTRLAFGRNPEKFAIHRDY